MADDERGPRRKLTDKGVGKLRPPAPGERVQLTDTVQPGLRLRVTDRGAKSWSVVYRVAGDPAVRRLTLGRHPAVTCAEARCLARKALAEAAAGRDPAAPKRARKVAVEPGERAPETFAEAAELYIARRVRVRMRTAGEVESLIRRRLVSPWGGRPIAAIQRRDVLALLDAELDQGRERRANKVLGEARRLFAWALEREMVGADPTAGIRPPGAERTRDRVLSDAELFAIWRGVGETGWPYAPFVKLLILTGQRRSEVAGMAWGEIDLDRAEWTLAPERCKSGRRHVVPLSEPVLEMLRTLPRHARTDLVLPSERMTPLSGFAKPKARLDRLAAIAPWRLHDLRRTCATGLLRLGQRPEVVARVLGHAPTTFLPGALSSYGWHHYHDEARRALVVWGEHVMALVGEREPTVVPLPRAGA